MITPEVDDGPGDGLAIYLEHEWPIGPDDLPIVECPVCGTETAPWRCSCEYTRIVIRGAGQ